MKTTVIMWMMPTCKEETKMGVRRSTNRRATPLPKRMTTPQGKMRK
jgi:hypothetical protein